MNAHLPAIHDIEALYAACLARVAPAENNRMRVAIGAQPLSPPGEPRPEKRVDVAKQSASHARITKALAGGGWVSSLAVAEAAGMTLGRARDRLREMCAEGVVSRRCVPSERGQSAEWCLGGGKSQAMVTVKGRILAHISGAPERWFTLAMICEEVGIPASTAASDIRDLAKAGLIEHIPGKPRPGGIQPGLWRAAEPGKPAAEPLCDVRSRLFDALSDEWQRPTELMASCDLAKETVRRHMQALLRAGSVDRRYTPGAFGMGHAVEWRRGTGQNLREQTVSERVIAVMRGDPGRHWLTEEICAAAGSGTRNTEIVLQSMRRSGVVVSRLGRVGPSKRTFWALP